MLHQAGALFVEAFSRGSLVPAGVASASGAARRPWADGEVDGGHDQVPVWQLGLVDDDDCEDDRGNPLAARNQ